MRLFMLLFVVISLESALSTKGSRVDVALETVLEFDPSVGQLLVNKLENVVKEVVGTVNQKSKRKNIPQKLEEYEFSEFLKDALDLTNTLSDEKLIELIGLVNDELSLLDSRKKSTNRKYLNKKIGATKGNENKIRRNLNTLLETLRNDNLNRKNSLLSDVIKSLYEINSKQKILNTMKNLKIFSRSQADSELVNSIKKSIRSVISNINLSGDKYGALKTFLDDLVKENDDKRNFKSNHVHNKLKSNRHAVSKIEPKRHTVPTKTKIKKYKKQTTKQTHMTLYPESINFIDKRKVVTFGEKSSKTESDEDSIKDESETDESIDNEVNKSTNKVETDEEEVHHDRRDEKYKNYGKIRPSKKSVDAKKTKQVNERYKNKNQSSQDTRTSTWDVIEKHISWPTSESSESVESFGNLYKQTDNDYKETIKQRKTKNKSENTIADITKDKVKSNKAFTFKYDNRRLVDKPILKTELRKTTYKLPTSEIRLKKSSNHILNVTKTIKTAQISNFNKSEEIAVSTTQEMRTKARSTKLNDFEIFTTKVINDKTNDNITKEEGHDSFKSSISFDINNYIKNSDIQDIKDVEKKNEIERKMKEDLNELFALPTTNTSTTDSYTDIFKDLEDEFGLR